METDNEHFIDEEYQEGYLDGWKDATTVHNETIKSLEEWNRELASQTASLQSELEALRKENEEQRELIKHQGISILERREKIQSLEAELERVKGIVDLGNEVYQDDVKDLRSQIAELEEQLKDYEAAIESIYKRKIDLQTFIEVTKKALESSPGF